MQCAIEERSVNGANGVADHAILRGHLDVLALGPAEQRLADGGLIRELVAQSIGLDRADELERTRPSRICLQINRRAETDDLLAVFRDWSLQNLRVLQDMLQLKNRALVH